MRDFLPTDKSQLPSVIISILECKPLQVGIGEMIRINLKNNIEIGVIKGARLQAVLQFTAWIENKNDAVNNLEQIIKKITDIISNEEKTIRKRGVLTISLEEITDIESSKEKNTWLIEQEAISKTIRYKLLYEEELEEKPTEGAIKEIDVEIKDGFKEKMVIKGKTEMPTIPPVPSAPTTPSTTPAPPEEPKKVNINTATIEELTKLLLNCKVKKTKQTAKNLADEIIKERKNHKFEDIKDIMKVKGFEESSFNKIKDAISV